jgi:hypothetical protein
MLGVSILLSELARASTFENPGRRTSGMHSELFRYEPNCQRSDQIQLTHLFFIQEQLTQSYSHRLKPWRGCQRAGELDVADKAETNCVMI